MTFRKLLEAKQVGIIYHFTKFKNMVKLLQGSKELNLDILEFISYNGTISTSRNYSMTDNLFSNDFPLKQYNIRIAIDGNKLSNRYKIEPVLGYFDNDSDIFNIQKNYKRIHKNSGEAEEAIIAKKIKLKKYIKNIQIYNYDYDRDVKYYDTIKELIKKQKLDITVELVRKFKPIKEDMIEEDVNYSIQL